MAVSPYAEGWFLLLPSDRIRRKEVKRLRRFGEELVIFRDAFGALGVTEAHCPHLGADLGGGTVVGRTLRCPFHGFRFDASGACVHVPTCEDIPSRLRLRAWEVREAHGAAFVWFHPKGELPSREIPAFAECEDPRWASPTYVVTDVDAEQHAQIDVSVDRLIHRNAPIHPEPVISRHVREGRVHLEALTATFVTPIDGARVAVTLMICFKMPRALAETSRAAKRFFARHEVA